MINYRELTKDDNNLINNLIINEGKLYQEFLDMGWGSNQIINQLYKKTNLSFGAFYNETLISFILGDLFNIEKIAEYEILLIYVCKHFRKNGLGKQLINKIEEKSSNLNKIYLEVSQNNFAGISFYTKMKFKTIHIRKNYFLSENERIDALAMTKTY